MATTRIMPLHIGKGRTESRAISKIIDYVANPQKTDHGRLITGYECDSRVADAEFMLAKRQYIAATGRVRGADDVIAYHVRQSFCPGEITPEEANRLGVEFAKRFTKGKHAFIVCTHIDKAHVHNHIIWSSVNLDCDRKFRNFWGSTKAVRRLSDTICIENGLSIVENPKPHGKSYDQWLGDQAKPSHRELLRAAIDNALAKKPADLDELLKILRESGCEVSKRGKSYRLKLPGWGKVSRLDKMCIRDREYHNIVAQPTEHQKEMVQVLSERASKVHSGSVDPSEDNMLKITGDGRKLGLDQRIINQLLPDEPGTKVNQCVANIMQIWRDGEADKLTQLVFCDISTPQAAPAKKAAKALDNPTLHALEQAVPCLLYTSRCV